VSLSRVKEDCEHFILLHPLDKELSSEALVRHHSVVLNNLVKVSDTLDSSLKVA
jgi:hypothetical protein